MATATYAVLIDWNNNGSFLDANEDVSEAVQVIRIERGRSSELQRVQAGTAEIILKNEDGKYSPPNTSSPLYGNLLPCRPLRIRATFGGETYGLFWGYIDRIVPNPRWDRKNCYIYAVDGITAKLATDIRLPMQTEQRPDQIIGAILDAVGWPAGKRAIDTEPTETIPYAWWDEASALQAIYDIMDSSLGLFYIRKHLGWACWEGRHHRLKPPHLTSQANYLETMVDLSYNLNPKSIKNQISAEFTNRTVQSQQSIWLCPTVMMFEDTIPQTIEVDFDDPVSSITTPVANVDFIGNSHSDGSGMDLTDEFGFDFPATYAQGCQLGISYTRSDPQNQPRHAYLTALQLRGTPVVAGDPIKKTAEDSTSQTAYGIRKLPLQGKFFPSEYVVQDFCDWYLALYKDPRAEISITLANHDKVTDPNTHFQKMLELEISDRITITATPGLELDDYFYIEKIMHEIREGGAFHETTWGVSPVITRAYWRLDYSPLPEGPNPPNTGTTRLAY